MAERLHQEEGTTLVEMMVAILVIAVALAALAQTLVGTLQATREAQDTQVVTAAALEMIEEMQALEWDSAAVYDGEVASADPRYTARLNPDGTYEDPELGSLELIELAGPVSAADRDPSVPPPSWVETRDDITYTFDLYPVWVDRSATADGAVDTKRFVVIATWTDPVRGDQELRTVGERAPTQAEAASNATGARWIFLQGSPDPVDADADDGTIDGFVTLRARSSVEMTGFATAVLTWNEPQVDGDGNVTGYVAQSEEVELTGTESGSGGGWVAFDGAFNGHVGNQSENGKYRFPNGLVDVEISGTPQGGGTQIVGTTSFEVRNSPYEDGVPDGEPSPTPTPTPTETDTGTEDPSDPSYDYDGPPDIGNITVGQICVSNGQPNLSQPITFSFPIDEVAPGDAVNGVDATVTVAYPHWSSKPKKNNPGSPDGVDSVAATWQSGTIDRGQWAASIPSNGDEYYAEGESITFTVTVTRSSDGANDSRTSGSVQINQC